MRMKLKLLRVSQHMTQEELADMIGITRNQYLEIEKGRADGKPRFWKEIQRIFNLTDAEAWDAMTNTEEGNEA